MKRHKGGMGSTELDKKAFAKYVMTGNDGRLIKKKKFSPLTTLMHVWHWIVTIFIIVFIALLITWAVLEIAGMVWGDVRVVYWIADLLS